MVKITYISSASLHQPLFWSRWWHDFLSYSADDRGKDLEFKFDYTNFKGLPCVLHVEYKLDGANTMPIDGKIRIKKGKQSKLEGKYSFRAEPTYVHVQWFWNISVNLFFTL